MLMAYSLKDAVVTGRLLRSRIPFSYYCNYQIIKKEKKKNEMNGQRYDV